MTIFGESAGAKSVVAAAEIDGSMVKDVYRCGETISGGWMAILPPALRKKPDSPTGPAIDQRVTSGTKRTGLWATILHDFGLDFSSTWRRTPGSWISRRYVAQSIAAGSKENSCRSSSGSDRYNWRV